VWWRAPTTSRSASRARFNENRPGVSVQRCGRDLRKARDITSDGSGPQRLQLGLRSKNVAWQKQVLSYLTSGNAVLLARQKGTGLSRASRKDVARWPVLAKIDGYTLFARSPRA
jgi:hypothetical protein